MLICTSSCWNTSTRSTYIVNFLASGPQCFELGWHSAVPTLLRTYLYLRSAKFCRPRFSMLRNRIIEKIFYPYNWALSLPSLPTVFAVRLTDLSNLRVRFLAAICRNFNASSASTSWWYNIKTFGVVIFN